MSKWIQIKDSKGCKIICLDNLEHIRITNNLEQKEAEIRFVIRGKDSEIHYVPLEYTQQFLDKVIALLNGVENKENE